MIIIIIIIIIEKEEKSQNTREAVRIKQRKIYVSAGNRTQDHSIHCLVGVL